jgi:nitroreductase
MESEVALSAMLKRRSVSPRRLTRPSPDREALNSIVGAGLRAPDHGGLLPWRVIEFPEGTREGLADLFENEKRHRDPLASPEDLTRAREHATNAPTVFAFVVRPQRHPLVPILEQWLGAGAALGNMLMAAHLLGYGAIMLSGERCQDNALRTSLDILPDEVLAGFLSIGTIGKAPPAATRPPRERVWSCWNPPQQAVSSACAPLDEGIASQT